MSKFFLFLFLILIGLLVPALGGAADAKTTTPANPAAAAAKASTLRPVWAPLSAADAPSVSLAAPTSALNDLDTPVTITGSGFAAVMDGTGTVVLTAPAVSLGSTALTDVTFVDSTTLTATVPFGMDTGPYALTVTNPDGGTGSLVAAFTVQAGIGKWNSGDLFGGEVRQILMKPGDPDTLYAPAYRIHGLFRSTDAGEHWAYAGADLPLGNGILAVDPFHPDWLYACTYKGLQRSQDEGDTWTTIMPNTWPDGRAWATTEVVPSPYHADVLFISAHDDWGFPASGGALGLSKSANGGTDWQIVTDLEGVSVVSLAFDPVDHQRMLLLTSEARVWQSTDGGNSWSEFAAKPPLSAVGIRGKIAYNPYTAGEVWIASSTPAAICKSTDGGASWNDVTEANGMGGMDLAFTGPLDVWTTRNRTTNGGASWDMFGTIYGYGELTFDPLDHQIAYLGDNVYGVQKSTDGGATWEVKDQGLAGLSCTSMDISAADPLRVYAAMGATPGIHRSNDGAQVWTLFSLPSGGGAFAVREDPTDPQRVYAPGHEAFFRSTDRGVAWDNLGWNASPPMPSGLAWVMEPDPFHAGHLLVGWGTGMYLTGPAYLYASSDFGASWHQVAMPQTIDMINDIAFDPGTPDHVYLTTNGTGVYRSQDDGGSWTRIDDPVKQPGLQATGYEGAIAIATHPQPLLAVTGSNGYMYRSADEGETWQKAENAEYPGMSMFVDGDSTRLYRGTGEGLFFSKDVGDTWTRAAGAFGHLQIMQVGYADMDGRAIIYAATNGGQAGASASAPTRRRVTATSRRATATASQLVEAGIYRYVVVTPKVTLKLSGLSGGSLRLGRRVTAKGLVTPSALAGSKVTLQVQGWARRWVRVKAVTRTIAASGAYGWTYQPAKRGTYRLRTTFAKTATHMAATTTWRTFKVK